MATHTSGSTSTHKLSRKLSSNKKPFTSTIDKVTTVLYVCIVIIYVALYMNAKLSTITGLD